MENLRRLLDLLADRVRVERVPLYFSRADAPEVASSGACAEIDLCGALRSRLDACLSAPRPSFPSDKKDFIIYSMLIRSASAFLRKDGTVCGGTFLRTILLLPRLKRMGVNMLYLLPVFQTSAMYKKGEIPSPYAVYDYTKLDPALHDDMLGEYSEELIRLQLMALIEACHALGIRVALDFVFRTIGRHNALIKDHPDWFYWVNYGKPFAAPRVDAIKGQTGISKNNVDTVYSHVDEQYFDSFEVNPKARNEALWDKLKGRSKLLSKIETVLSLTTAPAFSDWINDDQPPWTDVTYFRYELADSQYKKTNAPFVLFDNIKLNIFPPKQPNFPLYSYISGIIPYYQAMGIDGARIDMAHALPADLLNEIREKINAAGKDFFLWSEEFNAVNSSHARDSGFQLISGNTWHYFPRLLEDKSWSDMLTELLESELPVASALEIPDSPRIALKYNDKLLRLMHTMYALLPNTAMLINSGQETGEIQPMNLGVDNTEEGRFVLDKNDPMYGRLAFFDPFAPSPKPRSELCECIAEAVSLRKTYAALIKNGICSFGKDGKLLYLAYTQENDTVCFVFNLGEKTTFFGKRPFVKKKLPVEAYSYKVITMDKIATTKGG